MSGRSNRQAGPQNKDRSRLSVLCWCEAATVEVSSADVRDGLTGACKSPECKRIDRRERYARRTGRIEGRGGSG